MRKNKLITTIATASMIAALALTGCGSGNDASVDGTESTPPPKLKQRIQKVPM
jgi:hypothetical protein